MKGLIFVLCLSSLFHLWAYTPDSELSGPVKSVRTFKVLLRPVPAGEYDEPWFINADYDSFGRPVLQWYYHMGQAVRRHEFRYDRDEDGRERTTWLTYFMSPDLRPPLERLAGYEHWYTLSEGDNPHERETRFETVQDHRVKSVFRYYDREGRLIRETDSLSDLDTELIYDNLGRLEEKRGSRGETIVWRERYFYDNQNRLLQVIQTDPNCELYQREDYLYEEDRIIFNKYLLSRPVERGPLENAIAGHPWYRTVKYYDSSSNLVMLENYRDQGPLGLLLTEKNNYTHDSRGHLVKVEEIYRRQTWEMTYDREGNWISLTFQDQLNRPGESAEKWYRIIEYYK